VATSIPSIYGLNGEVPGINPLTGLPVDDTEKLDRRPVMIKVSNYPRGGRPHAGLSFADIVFEYYIGEQMNRFLAIYFSQDSPQVGPLRSGRLVDPQLVSMYGGILVYGGADPKVDTSILNILQERTLTHFNSPCPPICGTDTHGVTGVFVDSAAVTEYVIRKEIDNVRPVLSGMLFDEHIPETESFAIKIGVEYSFRNRGEWHFDPESQQYLRWIEADDDYTMIPLVDRVNNEQLRFANIIILYTTYVEYAPTLHDILIWDNISGRKAIIFRDATVIEGTWKVLDNFQPIQFYNRYGLPISLTPGKTWMVIVGNRSTIAETQPGNWEIQFDLP
jgi:hypothetical protein